MNKPQPTRELVIEPSEVCGRCLTLYAVSASARAFIKTECAGFGILTRIDTEPEQPVRAAESIVFSLHVWPNYDLTQVSAWLEAWPHVGASFENAINEVIKETH